MSEDMSDTTVAVLASIGIVVLLVVAPLFTILALNTLFGLSIAISLKTWAAAFWLELVVYGSTTRKT